MNDNYENQLLDEYLLDRLDEADRLKVEERAARDPAFAAEVELRRIIVEGIELAGKENLRKKIAQMDASLAKQGFFEASKVVRTPWFQRRTYLWAASIALLLSVGLWLFLNPSVEPNDEPGFPTPKIDTTLHTPQVPDTPSAPPTPVNPPPPLDKRYAALAKAAYIAPGFSNLRNTDGHTSAVEQASEAYESGDFQRALRLLDTISSNAPDYWQAAEIRAHSSFRLNKIKRATRLFRQIETSGQLPFSERAEWFLLICYGMDYPKGKNAFDLLSAKILADQEHQYYEQTKELAAKMSGKSHPSSD